MKRNTSAERLEIEGACVEELDAGRHSNSPVSHQEASQARVLPLAGSQNDAACFAAAKAVIESTAIRGRSLHKSVPTTRPLA